jgi:hypothetical protein
MKSPVQMATYPAMPTARPIRPAPKRYPTAEAERRRPSFRPLPCRNPKRFAARREHLHAWRRVYLSNPKPFMVEPPRPHTDPLPRHPATPGPTAFGNTPETLDQVRKRLTLTQQSDESALDGSFSQSLVGFRLTGDVDASGPWQDLRAGGCHHGLFLEAVPPARAGLPSGKGLE